ncbi:unnamed protein product, partial [Rhizoctonia solani]
EGQVCYSSRCPRHYPEQLGDNSGEEGLVDNGGSGRSLDEQELSRFWTQYISRDVVENVSGRERKRQQVIRDIILTECDLMQDLQYLRTHWVEPLQTGDIIPPERREDFVHQVFRNIKEISDVNSRLCELLTERQNSCSIVETIGDIFTEMAPHFHPFVQYVKHQQSDKYEIKKERSNNQSFAMFAERVERLPESRMMELSAYLNRPTERLARYPLLLEDVLNHTHEDNTDQVAIPRVLSMLRELLDKVSRASEEAENRSALLQLDRELVPRRGKELDLQLKDEQRQLVYKGLLRRRGARRGFNGNLQVFLFDHALLMVKPKVINRDEKLKVFR